MMAEKLNRTQILLEPEQHQALKKVAASEKISYSELMRIIVAEFLLQRTSIAKQREQLTWLKKAQNLQSSIVAAHGVAEAPSITEIIAMEREERYAQIIGRGD
jgi:hypothetical protein